MPAAPVLPDGRYPAYLTRLDVHKRAVTFDVIQYLTGDAADEAFHRDHPEDEYGVPNGFYIVNQNPRLRTLPVRQDATVRVVWLNGGADSEPLAFEKLPSYFAHDVVPHDRYVWYDPFWLTVHNGRITDLTEQYIP